jgi:hypothetical protein
MTIMCSSDLSDKVRDALVAARVDGFLQLPEAVGNKPGAAAEHGRVPRWEAEMFVAPMEDEAVQRVLGLLRDYVNKCDVEPCLRILVAPLDAVY